MRACFSLMLLAPLFVVAQNTFPSIGNWREHLPYHGVIDVAATGDDVFAATRYSLFSVDPSTGETQRYSRVSGLSETGISTISYDPQSEKLIVAYANSNIDVLQQGNIINIPDIKRTNLSGDKTIYHIYPDNQRAYLSTGLGVVVLDMTRYEVKESWFIGNTGSYVKTYGFTKTATYYYAATEEGLKRTPRTNANPADFQTWERITGSGLPDAPARAVATLQDKVIVLVNDTLYSGNGGTWNVFFANGIPIISAHVSGEKLVISQAASSGQAQVVVTDAAGLVIKTMAQPGVISFPRKGISTPSGYWIADQNAGLSFWTNSGTTASAVYTLDSPIDIATGQLVVYDNVLYAAAGSINDAWNYQYNRFGVYRLADGHWSGYNQYVYPQLDTLMDFIAVAVDPRDGSLWAGSYGGGLLHITASNQVVIYKQNSPLGQAIGDPGSYRVSGLAFDSENNLWISNYGSPQPLHVLKNDGTWQSFTIPFLLSENATGPIVIDDANQKWILSPRGNGLVVFNDNNTISNLADDQWRMYRSGTGAGNLPSNEVLSLVKDLSGFIWVGTNDGIGVIQCPESAFINGCEAVLPVIKEGAFANYLFKGEQVRSIAVDGADRKWIATSNGVWLVSQDGDKVLAHYTETNSRLLSNDVKSIAINGKTGEVFFGTAKGISSFRGAATEASETAGDVLVFPNPVPPGYTGTIGIRGVPGNSVVKIVETGGRLVYQARALGGQVTWDGRDYKGNRAATGVYLVMAVDQAKQEKVVAKIVFIE
ncbi:MAG TPA: hypothetical protein VFZ78_13290 [Flavisolibacter sp.]